MEIKTNVLDNYYTVALKLLAVFGCGWQDENALHVEEIQILQILLLCLDLCSLQGIT